ncbi:MAG: Cof-type HAD-IIB family hydrolase [Clostridia bacterium]
MNNKKFDGIHLFTDVDGTLASVHDEIPEKNIEAIDYFTKNGGTFSIATGRYLGDISILENLNINGLSILNNGACVYDFINKKIVSSSALPEEAITPLLDFCKKNEKLGLLIVNDDGYIVPIIDDIDRPIFNARYAIRNISELEYPYYKLLIVATTNILNVIEDLKKCNIANVDFVQSGPETIEIVPKNVSKGDTFLKICKENNIPKENTYFVGDSFNDITMMQNAGFSASMSKAHDIVKSHANIVICDFLDGSIYHMVKLIEEKLNN